VTRRSGGAHKGRGAKGHDAAGHERGRAPSQRQLRVGEELRHALARVLARGELSDPALDGVTVTVTEVRVSPDLRNATAFVTPFGGGEAGPLVKALNRAGGYFRGQIAHEVNLRLAPTIRFTADSSFDEAVRVERLLHDPAVARDLGDAPAADPDGDESDDGA
jgi:ribosome-binding factor A